MQPMKELARLLEHLASAEQYLFSPDDLRSALPEASPGAFKALLCRAEKAGLLRRVCRGIYLYPRVAYPAGLGLAAGAMIFVVSHEVIPETHRNGHQTPATLGLVAGFALMMVLDTALG